MNGIKIVGAVCASAIVGSLGVVGWAADAKAQPAACPTGTHATYSLDRQATDRCVADPQEDEAGWNCHTMGNQVCGGGRVYPTRIVGHFSTGWTVSMSDGSEHTDPSWSSIKAECKTDSHPLLCLSVWHTVYADYGVMRAILRSR